MVAEKIPVLLRSSVVKTKGKSSTGKGKPAAKPAAKLAAKPAAKPAKPPKSTRFTTKLPPAPVVAAPPPPRDELTSPRDIGRLTRYGERFGAHKIDVRMWTMAGSSLPVQLPVSSGSLAIFDPSTPKSWRVFDRPIGAGQFRIMLSIARSEDGKPDRLAAIVIHVGRPPIAKWTVAHYKGSKPPKSADQIPRCNVTSGWIALMDATKGTPGVVAVPPATGIQPIEVPLTDGRRALALPCGNGDYAAYWAVDAADKPICIVIDFDVFTQKEWKARPPA